MLALFYSCGQQRLITDDRALSCRDNKGPETSAGTNLGADRWPLLPHLTNEHHISLQQLGGRRLASTVRFRYRKP